MSSIVDFGWLIVNGDAIYPALRLDRLWRRSPMLTELLGRIQTRHQKK